MFVCAWTLTTIALLLAAPAAATQTPEDGVNLPTTVGAWSAPAQPRVITGETIFDYMNGAGEMYLAYRFRHLDVYEYTSAEHGDILVELYWMEHPDDAYGLLSDDWSGEALELGELTAESRRALYGSGYLRLAWDRLYVRVLAYEESAASRAAVEEIGRACVKPGGHSGRPALVDLVPPKVPVGATTYELEPDRVRFLRSYLVLNVAYYLASDDILALGPECGAVLAAYRPPGGDHTTRIHLLTIRYPDEAARQAGAQAFEATYLGGALGKGEAPGVGLSHIEAGWVATAGAGRDLVVVFDAPDADVASGVAVRAAAALTAGPAAP